MVLADAGYGVDGGFRAGLTALGLTYVVGVQPTLSVWRPGQAPLPPGPGGKRGRAPTKLRRDAKHGPISAKALAHSLPPEAWRTVCWREGTNTELKSRFTAQWLRPASRDYKLTEPHPEERLLIEWPEDDDDPIKYWLATLPADTSIDDLVRTAKLRWRIERDYQELKQEFGLGHFEGRSWRGFHHHASLCIAAYGFIVSQREAIPPSAPAETRDREKPSLSGGYRPRGSPDPAPTTRRQLDRDHQDKTGHRSRSQPSAMPVLHNADVAKTQFVTQ